MAEEVRRSGRATKGQHTKNQDALDAPLPKPRSKPKSEKKVQPARSQSVQSAEQEEEDNAVIRCVCGDQRDILGRQMICCDKCEVWQHVKCMGLQEGKQWEEEGTTYFCEKCKPEDHRELLQAMARGEKPWNRKKKSSKPSKPKSARPSDVKPDAETPNSKTTTPQQTPAPSKEMPIEPANGQTAEVPQQNKAATPPKKEPQSPSREKRPRDTTSDKDKDTAGAKRRKSSAQHHEKVPPQQDAIPADSGALPEKQRLYVDKFIHDLASMIKAASNFRGYRIPDGETPSSIALRLALQVNHATVAHHGEPGDNQSPYALQFRSILFNAKKNAILVDRLLSGSLTAEGLATMSSEEMASEEKQREYAAMREAAEKQMVLVDEPGPRLRKTHKGEEIVGEDQMQVDQETEPPSEHVHRESAQEDRKVALPSSPKPDDNAQVVELPEDIGQQNPLSVDTSAGPPPASKPPTNFDIQSVFNKVRSPSNTQQAFLPRRHSSIVMQDRPQEGPGDDADVDRLLKDEDNDVTMGDYSADPTIVWQGTLDMQSLGPFDAVARFVAGGDFGQIMPWDQLLSPSLPIQGRIESAKGNEYIQGLGVTGAYDVGVVSITPVTHEGRTVMDQLYNYFHSKDRWGVIPTNKLGNESLKDLYVIPVKAGGKNLPPFLDMLEYCTIETPRPHNMVLLALVAKLPETKPQIPPGQQFNKYSAGETAVGQVAQPAPPANGPANGPSPSPASNPHGPQFSPLQSAFPSGQTYGSPLAPAQSNNGHLSQADAGHEVPPHKRNPRAVEIFGPYIDAPVVVQVLSHMPDMPDHMMGNLKHIIDTVPGALNDTKVLLEHMSLKQQQQQQNGGEVQK
ncbi:hypothetical protein CC78DRAFT_67505 [Lojkania enalia]|uniref:Transcription factor BYE1 n=1 Tax=Lojkania enalia TaxID=147567 RepID=A0A9P4K1C8_9PLEO|nr:hypothetical protein CC78DRAFT_67505 [Didymosphaeria enalia]